MCLSPLLVKLASAISIRLRSVNCGLSETGRGDLIHLARSKGGRDPETHALRQAASWRIISEL